MRRRQITAAFLAITVLFGTLEGCGEPVTAGDDFAIEAVEAGDSFSPNGDGADEDFPEEEAYDAAEDGTWSEPQADAGGLWAEEDGFTPEITTFENAVETAEEEGEETAVSEEEEAAAGEEAAEEEAAGEEAAPGEAEDLPGGVSGEDFFRLTEPEDSLIAQKESEASFPEGYEEALRTVEEELNAAVEEAEELRPDEKIKVRRDLMTGVNEGGSIALYGDPGLFEGNGEGLAGAGSFASRYNLMEAGPSGVSRVRKAPNQHANGSCWAYAATAAGETAICSARGTDAGSVDDSETYVALFAHDIRNGEGALEYAMSGSTVTSELVNPFLSGGNSLESAALLVSSLGPAREGTLPAMPLTESEISSARAMASSYEWDSASVRSDHIVTGVECLPEPNIRDISGTWTGSDAIGRDAIKAALMEGCPVSVDIYSPGSSSSYVNTAKKSLYVDSRTMASSHQVVIVGWDDDFDSSNFAMSPPGDGAWICRNSWGNYEDDFKEKYEKQAKANLSALWPGFVAAGIKRADGRVTVAIGEKEVTFRESLLTKKEKTELLSRWLFAKSKTPFDEDGCFYLSYYDRVYHSPTVFRMGERSGFEGETLLQYDYLGIANVTSPEHSEAGGTEANVFRVSSDTDIRRVGVVTGEAASKVEVKIYLLKENAGTPVDGDLICSREAVFKWAGYHILDIDRTLTLPAGSSFSAVVSITGPNGRPYTPYEYSGRDPNYPGYVYVTEKNLPGQSYILTGNTWTDLAEYTPKGKRFYLKNVRPGNACIKVYTASGSSAPLPVPEDTKKEETVIPRPVEESTFSPLLFRLKNAAKRSVSLTWQEAEAADGYTIYGARYGRKIKKIADVMGEKFSFKVRNLKENTCFKYYIEAWRTYDAARVVTARSPLIYVYTGGGTYTNYSKVLIGSRKSVTLKLQGKTTSRIRASGVPKRKSAKLPVRKKLRYESTDSSVAEVSPDGKITAKGKGTAAIYVYAQNGVYDTVNVKVR